MSEIKEVQSITDNKGDKKEVTKIFLSGRLSATLIIPIEMARRHGLEKPSHVVVEERQEGILIKKLKLN
jgi:bifunctional DNA-binding transcriptional regulator/antitoxin component of YhaV-PrlF toxin-antitoxin module